MAKKEQYVIVRTYSMGVFAGILDEESTETAKKIAAMDGGSF